MDLSVSAGREARAEGSQPRGGEGEIRKRKTENTGPRGARGTGQGPRDTVLRGGVKVLLLARPNTPENNKTTLQILFLGKSSPTGSMEQGSIASAARDCAGVALPVNGYCRRWCQIAV